ncbi:hypothetical protein PAXINDRAFT_17198 [Paxillus involutus ATCC 200175]|uniref:Uncharacterized protein n=1 Tax=Paxillus involutus ATCC 200175 TaxID=664439 RepID=A0A0C9TPP1_PAXIN|nr:hypothetical protein PAXINDRAFT_17198 [Paxillus involutus ATCC 200175]
MPKVASWTFHRYFRPLTSQSVFPPERAISPPALTQHKVFPREEFPALQIQELVSSTATVTQARVLIPKPRGEVSRINRGGYNLQDKLGWPAVEYDEIRTFVIHLAREHLNLRKPWGRQIKEQLQIVFVKSKERYPLLQEYEGDWVVSDFLRVYLKNSSGRTS